MQCKTLKKEAAVPRLLQQETLSSRPAGLWCQARLVMEHTICHLQFPSQVL